MRNAVGRRNIKVRDHANSEFRLPRERPQLRIKELWKSISTDCRKRSFKRQLAKQQRPRYGHLSLALTI